MISEKQDKFTKQIIILIIVFIFIFVSFTTYIYLNNNKNSTIYSNKIIEVENESAIIKAIDKVYDSVLCISVYDTGGNKISTGTGFVYKKDNLYGYVVTNFHVINKGKYVEGLLSNNENIELTLLGSDQYSDLAVLRMNVKDVLQVATLGSSETMKVGNTVFTVGSPLGSEYSGTVTRGILAGKNRMVGMSTTNVGSSDLIVKVLQIDAAINPGNSGGPLVNLLGEVIGINSLKLVDDNIEGMGFALPIEDTIKYINRLENKEKIIRPALGVQINDLTNKYYLQRKGYTLSDKIEYGVLIEYLEKDYPAYKAGLKEGDVVTKINNKKIKTVAEFRYELFKYQLGDTINITYITGDKEKTVEVKLTNKLK